MYSAGKLTLACTLYANRLAPFYLTLLKAGIEKERKKATSERMAMALVMERLAELRNSFDENSESDYELKMRVAQVSCCVD